MKILSVVGARPNFMKIAPFCRAIAAHNQAVGPVAAIRHVLVHTGQHYDLRMSRAFFEALGIPLPDIDLEIGSGSHAEQVGRTMIGFEPVVRAHRPDWIVVVGDVNATCACAITAKKERVHLAHIEAGLRSGDLSMPEEINRLVTDRLADRLFTTDRIAGDNLRREGMPDEHIHMVGNIMIDTLEQQRAAAEALDLDTVLTRNSHAASTARIAVTPEHYAVMTLHRPSNVDDAHVLSALLDCIIHEIACDMPVLWPIHPRTFKRASDFGLLDTIRSCRTLALLEPLGYHELLKLNMHAALMLTDSGGLQEECCVLGTPCLTLRWNTERPVTLTEHGGTGVLVGSDPARLLAAYREVKNRPRRPCIPPLWDGHTAERIVAGFAAT